MSSSTTAIHPDPSPTGWQGNLSLSFAHRDNSTELIHSYSQAPLKIQRSFYPEGKEVCHNVILHTAGGIVGGDRLDINLNLQPHAHALVTSASAQKVYRSDRATSAQNIHIKIADRACLEWLPQETIVFNSAIYHQNIRVELGSDACWLGWDITRFGRTARGEKFTEGSVRSHTEVWQNQQPLWIDRQFLHGGEDTLKTYNALNDQAIVASLVWIDKPVSADFIKECRIHFSNLEQGEAGITRLEHGLVCRYRGSSGVEARNLFIKIWQHLRLLFLQRSICIPRAWLLSPSN